MSLSTFSIKNLVKVMCCQLSKFFWWLVKRKGGNSMFTKSKMAPVNISQNDYLALSLCLLCITVFNMCFLFGKQNCIIPNLNSDWLIRIKVHPSFKKNRMRFYSIKVLQCFWSKFSLTVVTVKNPSKTLIVTTSL